MTTYLGPRFFGGTWFPDVFCVLVERLRCGSDVAPCLRKGLAWENTCAGILFVWVVWALLNSLKKKLWVSTARIWFVASFASKEM